MNMNLSSYFEDPEFKDKLAKYEGMVESHTPTYFDAEELTDIAEYYAAKGEEEKSIAAIDFALRLHPSNTDALIFKSRSLCIKGNLKEAYQVLDLIEDRSDREVKFLEADLLIEERRFEEAESIHLQLAEEEEESFDVLYDIALVYLDANQKEQTTRWLEKIKEKGYNETNSQAFRDLWCDYCTSFVQLDQAINAYQITLDEHPYSISHWIGLTKCYLFIMDIEKAHEAADYALAIDDKNDEVLETKAFCYMFSQNCNEALKLFRKVLPRKQNPKAIYASIAKCYIDLDLPADAKEICIEWIHHSDICQMTNYEKAEVYGYIAMCCFNMHQVDEGMEYIDQALKLEPFNREAIVQKGMLYIHRKEDEKAAEYFQKALDMTPENEQVDIYYNYANCYYFLYRYNDTIECCKKIIELFPYDRKEAMYLMAASHYHLFDTDQCLKILDDIYQQEKIFEDEYIEDKRFKFMMRGIAQLLKQKRDQDNKS